MPDQTPTKGRRVTDDVLNPTKQALRIERLEGAQRLQSEQLRSSIDHLRQTLDNVQLDSRAYGRKLEGVVDMLQSQGSSKEAVGEMRAALGSLSGRIEEMFKTFEDKHDRRWERYEANRDAWRLRHEAENEDAQRGLGAEIRSVREQVIRFAGVGSAVGALAGVLVGGFLWNINYRFNDVAADTRRVERELEANSNKLDEISNGHGSELTDIKLYLARGGRLPEEPYIPKSQRQPTDGNQQQQQQAGSGRKP
jgi:hypothetical protein